MISPCTFDAVLLIGPTGAGKTPLGDHIQKHGFGKRRCHHFDFGSQLRKVAEAGEPPAGVTPSEHSFICDLLEKGLLLEDRHFPIAEKIVRNFLEWSGHSDEDLLLLNGLPRHKGQARDMEDIVNVTSVIVLECSAEDVHERISGNTGGDRTGRSDDSVEMIRKKLGIFSERTSPLVEYYSSAGSRVIKVPVHAASTTETVYEYISSLQIY
jgi:adenylate kinase family enzyme